VILRRTDSAAIARLLLRHGQEYQPELKTDQQKQPTDARQESGLVHLPPTFSQSQLEAFVKHYFRRMAEQSLDALGGSSYLFRSRLVVFATTIKVFCTHTTDTISLGTHQTPTSAFATQPRLEPR